MCRPLAFLFRVDGQRKHGGCDSGGVDGGEVEIGGGAEQQKVTKCEGWPSEKQNLVSSKESTPAKDTGTTVTRPQSQFNSEQSIKSDNVAPLAFPFPQ